MYKHIKENELLEEGLLQLGNPNLNHLSSWDLINIKDAYRIRYTKNKTLIVTQIRRRGNVIMRMLFPWTTHYRTTDKNGDFYETYKTHVSKLHQLLEGL